jgi:hypothetical protein
MDNSHLASREAFEDVGGCPYCLRTQGERIAAVAAKKATMRGQHHVRH